MVVILYEVRVYIRDLNLWIWASVARDTPARLCPDPVVTDHGCDIMWKHGYHPTLSRDNTTFTSLRHQGAPLITTITGHPFRASRLDGSNCDFWSTRSLPQ